MQRNAMEYKCKVVWVFLQEIILNALERFSKIILKVAVGKTVWKVKEIFFRNTGFCTRIALKTYLNSHYIL